MTFTTIKFFYNGIKVNGEKKLTKMNVYGELDGNIYIIYDWHWTKDFFEAIKEIAEYSFEQPQYWGDHGETTITIKKENPIYPCFKYMLIATKIRDYKMGWRKDEAKAAELEEELKKYPKIATEKIVNDAKEYINGVNEEIKRQAEIKRQEEEAERKRVYDEEVSQREIIKKYMNQFPIGNAKTYVRICWSEHPAFYAWEDNELTLSVKAAELVFTELDKKPFYGGYYKTKFEIIVDDEVVYIGRYDLGDEENGLFNHITSFAEYEYKTYKNEEEYNELKELIKTLIAAYENQEEIIVTFAEGFKEFIENYKKNNGAI